MDRTDRHEGQQPGSTSAASKAGIGTADSRARPAVSTVQAVIGYRLAGGVVAPQVLAVFDDVEEAEVFVVANDVRASRIVSAPLYRCA